MPLLDVRNLCVRFGPVAAVEDVSFAVAEGETLALVGESGCGKTLTARIASLPPTPPAAMVSAGGITLRGLRVTGLSESRDARDVRGKEVGIVFQDPLTALDPVWHGRRAGGRGAAAARGARPPGRPARAVEALAEVGIADPARR